MTVSVTDKQHNNSLPLCWVSCFFIVKQNVIMLSGAFYLLLCWMSLCRGSLCWVSHFIYCYAECPYAESHYAERLYAECYYAECHYCWMLLCLMLLRCVSLCWVLLCSMKLCWLSLCWVLLTRMSLCWISLFLNVVMLSVVAPFWGHQSVAIRQLESHGCFNLAQVCLDHWLICRLVWLICCPMLCTF